MYGPMPFALLALLAAATARALSLSKAHDDADAAFTVFEMGDGHWSANGTTDGRGYLGTGYMQLVGEEALVNEFYDAHFLNVSGFNPSIVALPEELAKTLHPKARFAVALKHSWCQCENFADEGELKHRRIRHPTLSAAKPTLAILDSDLNLLMRAPFNRKVDDIRLAASGDRLIGSYHVQHTMWDLRWCVHDIRLDTKPTKNGSQITKARLDGKFMSSNPPVCLKHEHNVGLIDKGDQWYVMNWIGTSDADIFPLAENADIVNGRQWEHGRPFASSLHNSVLVPIELPEINQYLNMAHFRYAWRKDGAVFGSKYVQYFYLMDREPPFEMKKISKELCFPSIDPSRTGQCEVIQYVSSVILDPGDPGTLLIGYGVNDCQAAVIRVSLQTVLNSMTHITESEAVALKSKRSVKRLDAAIGGEP